MQATASIRLPPHRIEGLPDGEAGVRETLKRMSREVLCGIQSPRIRQLALSIVGDFPSKHWRAEVFAVFEWVRSNIRFVRDPVDMEMIHSAEGVLDDGQGDCDDQAILVASLLGAIGHPTLFKAIGFAPREFVHVYAMAKLAGRWLALDTTEPYPLGWEPAGIYDVMIKHNRFGERSDELGLLSGDPQYGQIGGMIGSALGSIVGVPGLGSIIGGIAGLFGPSAHYTPSGLLYDTASEGLKANAVTLANMMNELYARIGVSTRVPVPQFSMTSADDPKVGPYMASLLNNPSLVSYTTASQLGTLLANGTYDAALQVQASMEKAIQSALDGLDSGTLVVVNGQVVPAAEAQAAQTPPALSSYGAVTGTAAPASSGSYNLVQSAGSLLSAHPFYVFGGLFLLVLLLSGNKQTNGGSNATQ